MSIQRIFSVFCCVLALLGICGSIKLDMFNDKSSIIGPGFIPLFYSLTLALFAVLLFFSDKSKKKFNFRATLLQGGGGKAFGFFLLNILLLFLLFVFGPFIAVLVFAILACFLLKRLAMTRTIVLFSIIYTGIFYFVFMVLFKMPFNRGIIFDLLGWYI